LTMVRGMPADSARPWWWCGGFREAGIHRNHPDAQVSERLDDDSLGFVGGGFPVCRSPQASEMLKDLGFVGGCSLVSHSPHRERSFCRREEGAGVS
jgi:hypothetical protein